MVLNSVIIPNSNYNKAIALMNEGKYSEAIVAFEEFEGYKDSIEQIVNCENGIIENKYQSAIVLMEANKYQEAIEAFEELDGYKDSAGKANSCNLKSANIGDYVFFGTYEQDNNNSNGKEDIEWLVLDKKDGRVLVISKYALDCKLYNISWSEVTWESCSLRAWLNNDFINTAFSEEEKAAIPTVRVSADKNPECSTEPGNATQDKVFLLSISEANSYFSSYKARQCEPTDAAVANGAYVGDNDNCLWWLRSRGYDQNYAAYVLFGGYVYEYGYGVHRGHSAVRPALWIDLNTKHLKHNK